jgi:predicted acyl esterase
VPIEVEEKIVRLRKTLDKQGFDAGAETIAAHLAADRAITNVPAVSTIWRILTRRGFITTQPHKRPRSVWKRFEAAQPNEGVLSVGFLNWWHTNTRALTLLDPVERLTVAAPQNQAAFDFIAQVLRHPSYDEFWRERTPVDRLADIDIPVYSIANWNQAGLHLRGNLYGYEQVRGPRKLLVNGGPIGDAHSSINIFNDQGFHEHLLGWFDQWLKGVNTGILDEPGSV